MRFLLRILFALVIFDVTGAPLLAAAVIEHVACEDEEGDGCCPTACGDAEQRCDDCACCFHVRPMLLARAMVSAPSPDGELTGIEVSAIRSNVDPREILHVPRRSLSA